MESKEIHRIAKEKFKGACRVCPVQRKGLRGRDAGIGGLEPGPLLSPTMKAWPDQAEPADPS